MSLTKIIRGAFVSRQKEIERYDKEAEALQMEVLHYLMSMPSTPSMDASIPSEP